MKKENKKPGRPHRAGVIVRQLNVKLNDEENKILEREREKENMSAAEWIRFKCFEK